MGTYFAKKGRFVAMATVDQNGACPQKAPVGPRVASGPGVHASCHLARVCGMPQVMIHIGARARGAKSGPINLLKQKPETSYSNRGYVPTPAGHYLYSLLIDK